jgi:hypothetical protein
MKQSGYNPVAGKLTLDSFRVAYLVKKLHQRRVI